MSQRKKPHDIDRMLLNGVWHEMFDFRFFHEHRIEAISNFYENKFVMNTFSSPTLNLAHFCVGSIFFDKEKQLRSQSDMNL